MTSEPSSGRQLFLDFPRLDPASRPLIERGPYVPALAALKRWKAWPEGQLALTGEAFSGKTRLLTFWAVEAGAALVTGEALAAADMDEIAGLSIGALAVDDADRGANGLGLLAALNLCRKRQAPVLLAGAADPGRWHDHPPDLRSRLTAMPVVAIGEPDDETLAQRLEEECARRHLNLPPESVRYLATRMPRTWADIGRIANQIEATPGRAYSRKSARNVLLALGIEPG